MSKTIHIELTEAEAKAFILTHSISTAMLAGRPQRAFETAVELLDDDNHAALESSALRKVCRATDPEAAQYAEFMADNLHAVRERRN